MAFSKILDGYDAESLFSICRRFHLLNDLENNKTAEMFELIKKSSQESEKFARQSAAAKIETHREINDMGGHENVAVEFLSHMKAVKEDYAQEAVRLAELLTIVIHFISLEILDEIKK